MRKQLFKTVESLIKEDEKIILLLGDIGVHGFSESLRMFPERTYNIGILEQSTIGLAAGLAMTGLIPIVHTIAPFLIERCYEQLKLDFGYQRLGGNFISVGGSYDYAALGCTHHCPADVGVLKYIPGMEIILPGTAPEFDSLFRQTYNDGQPTYFRLSERVNEQSQAVEFGNANVIKKGKLATIIAVGPALQKVINACADLDVTILYYTTIAPFDIETLRDNCPSNKVLLCEPYYSGALSIDIINALAPQPIKLSYIGVPPEFLNKYGRAEDHDEYIGFTVDNIINKVNKLIYE
jgi:transketolase